MGFLSKVAKGIKKGFKKVVGFVGKLASSKFGKILLAAVTIFTLGTALIAGAGAFASTAGGFAAKFVAGAKAFGAALASPLKAAKGLFNGGQAAGQAAAAAGGAAQGAGAVAGAAAETANTAAAVGAAAPASTPIAALAGEGVAASGAAAVGPPAALAGGGPGLLSKAAGVAGKALANPATATLIGQAAQGVAAGVQQERILQEERRERQRIDQEFRDPAKIKQLQDAANRPLNIPGGFIDRAQRVADFMNNRPGSGSSGQPGNPDDVYGRYVVGY